MEDSGKLHLGSPQLQSTWQSTAPRPHATGEHVLSVDCPPLLQEDANSLLRPPHTAPLPQYCLADFIDISVCEGTYASYHSCFMVAGGHIRPRRNSFTEFERSLGKDTVKTLSQRNRQRGGQHTELGVRHPRHEAAVPFPLFVYSLTVASWHSCRFIQFIHMNTINFSLFTFHYPLSPLPLLLKPFFLTSPLAFSCLLFVCKPPSLIIIVG